MPITNYSIPDKATLARWLGARGAAYAGRNETGATIYRNRTHVYAVSPGVPGSGSYTVRETVQACKC